jgi:hypothetical protein
MGASGHVLPRLGELRATLATQQPADLEEPVSDACALARR